MTKKPGKLYWTHGKEQLMAEKGFVNGILSMVYTKNGKVVSFEPWEDVQRQMMTGPYTEYTVDGSLMRQQTVRTSL